MKCSPCAEFCADTGAYTGVVPVGDTGAEGGTQVELPLSPVVVAVCSPSTVWHDLSHPWDMVTGTLLILSAMKNKSINQEDAHFTVKWYSVKHSTLQHYDP